MSWPLARFVMPCQGTERYPGCGQHFEAHDMRQRFCPECAALDKPRSFVFEERRRARAAQQAQEEEA